MFDVGFSELLLLAVIALVVLGPEKLPHAARMAGAWIGRIRRLLVSVQADIESEVAAAEMRERIRKEMEKAKAAAGLQALDQELQKIDSDIRSALDDTRTAPAPTDTAGTPAAIPADAPIPQDTDAAHAATGTGTSAPAVVPAGTAPDSADTPAEKS
ncbi:UNVERIFIED_CONTAM: tatB [Trichonephila clavipes]